MDFVSYQDSYSLQTNKANKKKKKRRILFYHKELGKKFTGFECMASAQRLINCSDFEQFAKDISSVGG